MLWPVIRGTSFVNIMSWQPWILWLLSSVDIFKGDRKCIHIQRPTTPDLDSLAMTDIQNPTAKPSIIPMKRKELTLL